MTSAPSIDGLLGQAAAFRRDQKMEEALELLAKAARLSPGDPRAAFGFAQTSFECWRPAAEHFAAARQLVADQPELIRNHALALAAEGDYRAATELLDVTVGQHPLWLDGHRTLASLRITHGEAELADASYARACAQQPDNAGLRLSWFQHHVLAKDWSRAGKVLDDAPEAMAANEGIRMARIFLQSEKGGGDVSEADFAPFADRHDPGFDLCHLRFLLRKGRPDEAARLAERHISGPQARNFWPYLALCWRLLDDPRAAWLDGDPPFVTAMDLDISHSELDVLADVLRGLHRLKAPYPEQSVRGGTQTDRQLFFHPDPAIQAVRTKVTAAICDYAEDLPAGNGEHPLLDHPRNRILFEGSWSVRLTQGGYHASHTHILGWLSSALYIQVPESLGASPAGCLALGAPPVELGLALQPYMHIEPKPGRLALFPSTMWHATEPFDAGERLTIAFDVKIPDEHLPR